MFNELTNNSTINLYLELKIIEAEEEADAKNSRRLKRSRTYKPRNHDDAHERPWKDYFDSSPRFQAHIFRRRFRDNTGDGGEQSEDSEGTVVKEPHEENLDCDANGGIDDDTMFRMDSRGQGKGVQYLKSPIVAYFDGKNSQLKPLFLKEIIRRCAWVGDRYFGLLLEICSTAKSKFMQVKVLDLLLEALKPFVSVNKSERTVVPGKKMISDNTGDGGEQSEDSEGTIVKEPHEENSDGDADGGIDDETISHLLMTANRISSDPDRTWVDGIRCATQIAQFLSTDVLLGSELGLLSLAIDAACAFRAEEMPSLISCWMAAKVMAGVSDVDVLETFYQ
ncbi:hypothetical protein Tco_0209176 [Tanacetum coccineum]